MIKLNKNENKNCNKILFKKNEIKQFEYPQGYEHQLIKMIAARNNVKESFITIVNGLDEGIFLFMNFIKSKNGKILLDIPNYSGIFAMIQSLKIEAVFNQQGEYYDYTSLITCLENDKTIKFVYISNPRNPYGDYLSEIENIIKYCNEKNIIVFLDEAYIEFIGPNINYVNTSEYDNLIIGRTFSKAYGLAGIRCGYLINCNKEFQEELNKLRLSQPYHVSEYTLKCALKAYNDIRRLDNGIEKIKKEKELLYKTLDNFNIKYIKSDTNFIIVFFEEELTQFLFNNDILIEQLDKYRQSNGLRVSIGDKKEMRYLKHLIKTFYGGK